MNTLKVKILGSGNAAQKHARAFAELSELYTVTDSDDHDIVDICTPNYMHCQQTCEALQSGKHAIVEKPICGSLQSCDIIADLARETGKRVIPIFQYRFGGHGKIRDQIVTRWRRDKSYHDNWRGDWRYALGGALTSHGIHAIDLALLDWSLRGEGTPFIVTASMDTHLGPERFADIFMGEPDNMMRIATFIDPAIEQAGFNFGDSQKGFVEQFRSTHEALTTGGLLPVTLAEARQSLEVLTAAYWSAYTGEPAMLPIGPDHPFYAGWSEAFAQRSKLMRPVALAGQD